MIKGNDGSSTLGLWRRSQETCAQRMARLRRVLYEAITDEDMVRMLRALVQKALAGDLGAIRLLMRYAS